MSSVALHFASGAAFFSGSGCLLAGLLIVSGARRKLLPPMGRLLILAGLFLIIMSATPLPLWAWSVWGVSLLLWTASRFARQKSSRKGTDTGMGPPVTTDERTRPPPPPPCEGGERLSRCQSPFSTAALVLVVGVTLAAVLWELSWQFGPRGLQGTFGQARKPDLQGRLVVIGDSLSAEDFTEGGEPWPTLLAREHGIEIVNLAFSGATARSAEKRVTHDDVAGAIVLVEIGGNDVLGSTSPAEFERNLDRLLVKICEPERSGNEMEELPRSNSLTRPPRPPLAKGGSEDTLPAGGPGLVVMLELPLPPLYNRFGQIQRRLAQRHGVVLIPKRYFASVLIGEQATLDGLHLSPAGHQKMCDMIWRLFAKSRRS